MLAERAAGGLGLCVRAAVGALQLLLLEALSSGCKCIYLNVPHILVMELMFLLILHAFFLNSKIRLRQEHRKSAGLTINPGTIKNGSWGIKTALRMDVKV